MKRAERISLTVKKLKALSSKDYEDFVTGYEKILFEISYTLGTEDKRDLSFEQQGKALVTFINTEMKNLNESEDIQQQLRKKLSNQVAYSKLLEDKIEKLNKDLAELKQPLVEKETQEKDAVAAPAETVESETKMDTSN